MQTTTPEMALEQLLLVKKAAQHFGSYIRVRHPDWKIPEFHDELIDILDKFEKNELTNPQTGKVVNNLIITEPPRHGKSTYSTVEFPSYYIGRDPARYIMTASYNAELATDFGREVRNIVADPIFKRVFPATTLAKDSQSAATWRTNSDGAYFGLGLGGSTSGRPANMLIIDDPYKNRPDAESPTVRKKVWEYYLSALRSRLQPTHDGQPAKTIVIHTRWHPDDLIGRIQQLDEYKEGDWLHVNFPAILDEKLPTERALWPERFSLESLKKIQRVNPREFQALYQQKPTLEGGNIIQSDWWQFYPPDMLPESFSTLIIAADTAFKKNQGNDFTSIIPMALSHEGDIFILDLVKGRWSYPEAKLRLIQQNNLYRGRGLRGLYIEDKASGQSLIQDLKLTSGISVIPYKNQDDKVARAHSVSPLVQGGRVFLPQNAPWLPAFLLQVEQFPDGAFDDDWDAAMIGLDVLSKNNLSMEGGISTRPSLLEEYNQNHDLIMGRSSLNQELTRTNRGKTPIKWRGWGV